MMFDLFFMLPKAIAIVAASIATQAAGPFIQVGEGMWDKAKEEVNVQQYGK